jgi:putative acetyltransferase
MIRPEREADHETIDRLVTSAFGAPGEAQLIDAIRASAHYLPDLSLVAVEDGAVVGHVMISQATLGNEGVERPIAILAPLAVDPDHQRSGIGSALVTAATSLADERGEPAVVLVGDPAYYGRFGFEHARPLGIELPLPSFAPSEAGQVLRLRTWDTPIHGAVAYSAPFDLVEG